MGTLGLGTLALVTTLAVVAPIIAHLLRRFLVPVVVVEIVLGIVVGPQVLGWTSQSTVLDSLAEFGLAFLMFLVGYEINFARVRGRPLLLGTVGWLLSLVLALGIGTALVSGGLVRDRMIVGLALTSTALGTILPSLRDARVTETRFGGYVLAAGTLGEFGPIVAMAILLVNGSPLETVLLLVGFVVVAVGASVVALQERPPAVVDLLRRNLNTSAQLPVRISVMLIMLLIYLASILNLSTLLGAFAAGIVVRLFTTGDDAGIIRTKLEAIGYGLLVPIFFITTGIDFDLDALTRHWTNLWRMLAFLLLMLVARGLPALVLYRRDLRPAERASLGLFSATGLPLVVVVVSLGLATGRIRPDNAASLVAAGLLSVLVFPSLGLLLARRSGDAVGADGSIDNARAGFDGDA